MKGNAGLTLVEVLVALALMGTIFALLTSWQASTLNLSARTAALSHSLAELNDTSGYLGDRLRAAVRVRVATANLSVNGAACTNVTPCLAIVVPEYDPGGMTRYHLHTYRLEARSRVSPADKVTDSWAEANVQVLREYRSTDPFGGSGSTPRDCVATPAGLLAIPRSSGQDRAIRPAIWSAVRRCSIWTRSPA
ncbi:type II secretion system protein J [Deinococcus malanensis]|uniref:type II secretion system protein J n=1 Tax=Deinococcus malanensis TaxID=1706855 RepID=UPI00363A2E5F